MPRRRLPLDQIDTFNFFGVGVREDRIVIARPLPLELTRLEAITLAAWLVVLADDASLAGELPVFDDLVTAIRNT